MVRYAFSRGCRTRFIYDYFAGGARGGAAPRCGTCDVCLGWGRATGRALDEAELLRVRIALSGVGRLSGTLRRRADRAGADRKPGARGAGSRAGPRADVRQARAGVPIDQVKDLLGRLADAGLIERQGIEGGRPGAFVLAPHARRAPGGDGRGRGRSSRFRPPARLPVAKPPRAGRRAAHPERVARGGRTSGTARPPQGLAHRGGPAPRHAALRDLPRSNARRARRRTSAGPARRSARVPGIGPAKLERYGAALLALLEKAEKSLARRTG